MTSVLTGESTQTPRSFLRLPGSCSPTCGWRSTTSSRLRRFKQDCASGNLAPYTFLEPSFLVDPNDEHPPHDVVAGEQFLYDIWQAVSQSPAWPETLLMITYDEHGGTYDHVHPPFGAATPDAKSNPGQEGFTFNRFGVRVPTVLVSPWIQGGNRLSHAQHRTPRHAARHALRPHLPAGHAARLASHPRRQDAHQCSHSCRAHHRTGVHPAPGAHSSFRTSHSPLPRSNRLPPSSRRTPSSEASSRPTPCSRARTPPMSS